MALQELVIVNPARKTTKRRRTNKRKVNNMARRKVSRRSTTARRKAPARRTTTRRKTTTRRRKAPARRTTTRRKAAPKRRTTTRRKTTTRRRKAPARRTTTRRKTTTRRRKAAPKRRTTTRRKTTTRRRKSPARRKTTTRRRKSPARRRSTRRKTTGRRRRTTSRRKTASRRRSVSRRMSLSGAMKWTRSNLMKFEMMAALAGGIAVSAALPGLAQRALSKVGLNIDITSGYRATVSSLALAGLGGYALYSLANVSAQTAGLFTVAAMVPAALGALNNLGLPVPSIHVSGGPLASGTAGLFGLLGNAPSVIDEPLFGGYDMVPMGGQHGEMFGLGGKDINLF